MLSQSDDGGGLSLLDDDDSDNGSVGVEFSGDRDENRSFNSYGGEFGLGTTSGHFVIDPSKGKVKKHSKGKVKKHTFGGFSSRRRSSFNNIGYTDSSISTQGYYPLELPPIFSTSDYNHMVALKVSKGFDLAHIPLCGEIELDHHLNV
ncbi:hypothetical protein Gotur_018884 [Gossypium turneri]